MSLEMIVRCGMLSVLFVLFILARNAVEAQGFQKDLDLNTVFPPILDRRDGIPTGHLRPLGWQSRADAPINEAAVSLEPDTFWDAYVSTSTAVVLRGLTFGADAVDKWTDMHLNRAYGKLEMRVTHRKQTLAREEELQMGFRRFLQGYRVDDWYLRGIMPAEMMAEAPIVRLVNCGPYVHASAPGSSSSSESAASASASADTTTAADAFTQARIQKGLLSSEKVSLPQIAQLIESYIWMSAGETSSFLHSHPDHNLHCVLDGRKDFIIIPTDQFASPDSKLAKKTAASYRNLASEWRRMLDMRETYAHSGEWYSSMDVDMVNAFKYKLLHDVVWHWASLRAGDCVYVPANALHQIRSHGRSISSSVYFTRMQLSARDTPKKRDIQYELFAQCATDAPLFEKMSGFGGHFLWTYTHGVRHLNGRNMHAADAKRYLLYLMRDEARLYYTRFEHFVSEIAAELRAAAAAAADSDTLATDKQAAAALSARDIWNDMTSGVDMSESDKAEYMRAEDVHKLRAQPELARFVDLLNAAASFHDPSSEHFHVHRRQHEHDHAGGHSGAFGGRDEL